MFLVLGEEGEHQVGDSHLAVAAWSEPGHRGFGISVLNMDATCEIGSIGSHLCSQINKGSLGMHNQ